MMREEREETRALRDAAALTTEFPSFSMKAPPPLVPSTIPVSTGTNAGEVGIGTSAPRTRPPLPDIIEIDSGTTGQSTEDGTLHDNRYRRVSCQLSCSVTISQRTLELT